MSLSINFSERLKSWRERRNMSQAKLADLLGVSSGTVGTWETGGTPPIKELERMCAKLGVSPGWLLGLNNEEPAVLREGREDWDWMLRDLPESMLVEKLTAALRDAGVDLGQRVRRAQMFLDELRRRAAESSSIVDDVAKEALGKAVDLVKGESRPVRYGRSPKAASTSGKTSEPAGGAEPGRGGQP